jgi:hypothetical protein
MQTRLPSLCCVALGLALAFVSAARADEAPTRWIKVEGSADVRGAVTQEEALARARDEARLEAVRRALGTAVNAATTAAVSERGGSLTSLTVSEVSTVEAGIVISEEWGPPKSMTETDPSTKVPYMRYVVSGRFEVAPLPAPDGGLSVQLSLNRQQLVAGQDLLSLTVKPNEDVYALVFNLAADEKVYPIYPNARLSEALRLPGNRETQLPREKDPIVLRPQPAKGHKRDLERVRVIVSRKPLAPPPWGSDGAVDLPTFFRWQHQKLRDEAWAQAERTYEVRLPDASR